VLWLDENPLTGDQRQKSILGQKSQPSSSAIAVWLRILVAIAAVFVIRWFVPYGGGIAAACLWFLILANHLNARIKGESADTNMQVLLGFVAIVLSLAFVSDLTGIDFPFLHASPDGISYP
jgi:hypothetical protein